MISTPDESLSKMQFQRKKDDFQKQMIVITRDDVKKHRSNLMLILLEKSAMVEPVLTSNYKTDLLSMLIEKLLLHNSEIINRKFG